MNHWNSGLKVEYHAKENPLNRSENIAIVGLR